VEGSRKIQWSIAPRNKTIEVEAGGESSSLKRNQAECHSGEEKAHVGERNLLAPREKGAGGGNPFKTLRTRSQAA